MVTGSNSLVEALCYSIASGLIITSLQARDCGIAFLQPMSISHPRYNPRSNMYVHCHSLPTSSRTTLFAWDGGKLALPCLEHRQQELQRAITSGLLGLFISAPRIYRPRQLLWERLLPSVATAKASGDMDFRETIVQPAKSTSEDVKTPRYW